MTKRILGVVAVFGFGVGIGCAASPFVVPKASAQQSQLPALEYLCLDRSTDSEELTSDANKLATQRWELTASLSGIGVWCWKRPKM